MKNNILFSLNQARRMTQQLIDTIDSPEDWLFQVHPKANHPLWIVGHLGLADNHFLSRLNESADHVPEGWKDRFWFGSEIRPDADHYPDPQDVLSYFYERRESLLKTVAGLTDEFLLSPPPTEGMFSEAPNMGQMLFFISFHEGIHFGQFTVAHRGLGNSPLMTPQPAAESTS